MTREHHRDKIKKIQEQLNQALISAAFDGYTIETDLLKYSIVNGGSCDRVILSIKETI